ncbi:MAG: methyltransferase [Alphaproteobacteria bacterium]|nr:methyltransferase [Alphaproteobacteria bacterium]MCL2758095.1 methyltransferase [Alphaproteobacteria bacterium]
MPKYYSSFAAGFEKLVHEFLAADIQLDNAKVLEGAIVYDTPAKPDVIREIKYFKNSFLVLGEAAGVKNLEEFAARLAENTPKIHAPWKARDFHLSFSYRNTPVKIDGASKARLVDAVANRTRLRFRSGHGDVEFWISVREDGAGFFMQRLTPSQTTAPGELESHVAAALCRASAPKEDDIFIDPFCGSGAIALTRARMMPYRGIFAADIDPEIIADLRLRARSIKNSKIQKSFFIKIGNFLENKFDDNFASAIVTDPPWGLHTDIDADFYPRVMAEFARILKPGGRLVLLTARDIEMPVQPALSETAGHKVLIHGRKASLRVFSKNL